MNIGYALIPLVFAALVVVAVTPLLIRLGRRYSLYDEADDRKVHPHGISRLGGIGITAALGLAGLAAMQWGDYPFTGRLASGLGIGLAPVFLVSLWDDLKSLPWWVRLGVQAVGAGLFAVIVPPMDRLNLPLVGTFELGFWSYPLVVAWLVLTTNAINFIDGLDGLAAGIAAIAGVVFMIASFRAGFVVTMALSASLVGACLGFLPYNFPPARIFMGDSGSTVLGFVLGVIALVGAGKNVALVSLLVPFIALGIPILDTIGAIIRRTYRGRSIFEADRRHIHHRLLSLGLGYRRTVVLLYLVSALLGGIALLLATGPRMSALFIVTLVAACFLLFFSGRRGSSAQEPR